MYIKKPTFDVVNHVAFFFAIASTSVRLLPQIRTSFVAIFSWSQSPGNNNSKGVEFIVWITYHNMISFVFLFLLRLCVRVFLLSLLYSCILPLQRVSHILEVFSAAEKQRLLSVEMFQEWVCFCLHQLISKLK